MKAYELMIMICPSDRDVAIFGYLVLFDKLRLIPVPGYNVTNCNNMLDNKNMNKSSRRE